VHGCPDPPGGVARQHARHTAAWFGAYPAHPQRGMCRYLYRRGFTRSLALGRVRFLILTLVFSASTRKDSRRAFCRSPQTNRQLYGPGRACWRNTRNHPRICCSFRPSTLLRASPDRGGSAASWARVATPKRALYRLPRRFRPCGSWFFLVIMNEAGSTSRYAGYSGGVR